MWPGDLTAAQGPQVIQVSFGRDLVRARSGAVSQTFVHAHAYKETGVKLTGEEIPCTLGLKSTT